MKIKNYVLFFVFLLPTLTHGKNISGYCFPATTSLAQAKRTLSAILHPKDKIYLRESMNCLEVDMQGNRQSLYETLLNQKFKLERVYHNSESSSSTHSIVSGSSTKAEPCLFVVKKESKGDAQTDSFSLGKKTALQRLEENSFNVTESQLLVDSGASGLIQVDGQSVKLTCLRFRSKIRVKVELADSKGRIATSVTVKSNKEIDLGSIVNNLNDKNRDINLRKGISRSKSKGKLTSKYSLRVR